MRWRLLLWRSGADTAQQLVAILKSVLRFGLWRGAGGRTVGRLLRMNGVGLITLELLWIQRSGLSRVGVMSGAAYALQVGGWLSDHWPLEPLLARLQATVTSALTTGCRMMELSLVTGHPPIHIILCNGDIKFKDIQGRFQGNIRQLSRSVLFFICTHAWH